jgi:hypothetical protein
MDNLIIVNKEEKRILKSSRSQISIYKVIFDRLSQNKNFSKNDLEALTKIENSLNINIEFKQKILSFKFFNFSNRKKVKTGKKRMNSPHHHVFYFI